MSGIKVPGQLGYCRFKEPKCRENMACICHFDTVENVVRDRAQLEDALALVEQENTRLRSAIKESVIQLETPESENVPEIWNARQILRAALNPETREEGQELEEDDYDPIDEHDTHEGLPYEPFDSIRYE